MGRAFEYRRAAKEKRWGHMSRIFPKLSRAITVAAKAGGPDPSMNPKLRTAIQNAKSENMPKDNVESAIKRAFLKDQGDYIEENFEGKGPYGVLIFIECATDNNTRTVANVKSYFSKAGGSLVPTGSLEFMFSRKAIFEFDKTDDIDLEELELDLIDAGLEEIEEEEGTVYITGDYTSYGKLSTALEEKGIEVNNSSLKRFPNTTVELNKEQMEEIQPLLEKLEDDDDVQQVFTNIA